MLQRIGQWFQKNPETIPLGIGVLCLLLAAALLVNPIRLIMYGISSDAVVTDVVERTVLDSQNKVRVESTATIRFRAGDRYGMIQHSWSQDRDGMFSFSICVSGCYAKGDQLKVRYLEDDLEIAAIDSFLGLFGASIILGVVGAMGIFLWRIWRSGVSERVWQW
jgi:hypothetical protein